MKKALESELHGKIKVRKKLLDVAYDFRKAEQAEDFSSAGNYISLGGGITINLGGKKKETLAIREPAGGV